jgi:mono/diheme cytochrome c family protein
MQPQSGTHRLYDRNGAGQRSEATTPPAVDVFMNLLSGARSVQPPIAGPVTAPPAGPTAEYGQYLASSIGACRDCHGPNLAGNPPGGNAPAGPNLTTLGQCWSEADFIKAIRTGTKPDGKMLSDEMPWKDISAFASDDDLKALYAYLKSLQPLPDAAQ